MAFKEMVELTNGYDFQPDVERASRMLVRKTIATNALTHGLSIVADLAEAPLAFRPRG